MSVVPEPIAAERRYVQRVCSVCGCRWREGHAERCRTTSPQQRQARQRRRLLPRAGDFRLHRDPVVAMQVIDWIIGVLAERVSCCRHGHWAGPGDEPCRKCEATAEALVAEVIAGRTMRGWAAIGLAPYGV